MPSKQDLRIEQLKRILTERGRLHLRDVAALLDVSEMTVRRDIAAAAQDFINLGGHIFLAPAQRSYTLAAEAGAPTGAKAEAARQAARLLKANTTVFIDSGTTLLHLVDAIPADFEITVVTSSLNVATRIADRKDIRLLLLGGLYHPASDCFIASSDGGVLNNLGINIAFFSAGGYDASRGASCYQFYEAQIKRAVMVQCWEKHLVIDSSKIGHLQPIIFATAADFVSIITEHGPA